MRLGLNNLLGTNTLAYFSGKLALMKNVLQKRDWDGFKTIPYVNLTIVLKVGMPC